MNVADYQLLTALSDAGVYEARDRDGNPCVVTTITLPTSAEADLLHRRLQRLCTIRHPHLAVVTNVLQPAARELFVVTEALSGVSLATVLQARKTLTDEEVASVWAAIASALGALHERGIVHGDVAPANVMVTASGAIVLIDLCARLTLEAGTAGYVAPERQAGAPASAAGDLWSFGTLLNSLTTAPALHRAAKQLLHPDPHRRLSAREFGALQPQFAKRGAITLPSTQMLAVARLQQRAPATRVKPHRRIRQIPAKRAFARTAGFAAALSLIATVGWWVVSKPGERRAIGAQSSPSATETSTPRSETAANGGDLEDEAALLQGLLTLRDRALNSGDQQLLAQVYQPGAPALNQDIALLESWQRAGERISGLQTTISEVQRSGKLLRATITASSYHHHRAEGERVIAAASQCRAFELAAQKIAAIDQCSKR